MSINGTNSEKMKFISGAPQGFLLGARLLSIFAFVPWLKDGNVDSTAYIVGNFTVSIQTQNLLHQLPIWCKFNPMFIHPAKSEVKCIWKNTIHWSN